MEPSRPAPAIHVRWAGPLCVLGLWALYFAPHLLGSGVPYYRDQLVTLLPIRHYLHARLLGGQLPMWYPYEGLGVPFIGQIVTATFHPQTLLFLPFTPATALKLNLLGSYLVGAWGAYALGRVLRASRTGAVAGACALAFGGYALGVSHNLVYAMGTATLPWVACAALRVTERARPEDAAGLMGAWALVFLAGDAQMFALCPLLLLAALGVHGARRRALLLLGLAGLGASLLVCVELLPALSVSRESVRGAGAALPSLGLTWALHPLRLPELLVPGFVPDTVRNQLVAEVLGGGGALWSTTLFAGALVLLCSAWGVASRQHGALAFAAVALLGLWLALGERGGLLPLAWRALPLLAKFRYPEKYLALFWLGLVPLVALGFDRLCERARAGALTAAATGLGCAALAGLAASGALATGVWRVQGRLLEQDSPLRAAVEEAWGRGLLASAGFLLAGAGLLWLQQRRPALRVLLPLLLFAELLRGNGAQLPLLPAEVLREANPLSAPVLASSSGEAPAARLTRLAPVRVPSTVTLGDGERWVRTMRQAFHLDTNGPEGIAAFGTNLPATPLRYGMLFGAGPASAAPWAARFHGCFWSVSLEGALPPGLQWVSRNEALGLGLARGACAPRAWLAGVLPARDPGQALRLLRGPVAQGRAVVEGAPAAMAPVAGEVRWLHAAPEQLQLQAVSDGPAVLVVRDQLASGWSATLDGAPVPILPADVAVRAVLLPTGEHEVVMRYRTPALAAGALLSGLGLLLLLGLLLTGRVLQSPTWRRRVR